MQWILLICLAFCYSSASAFGGIDRPDLITPDEILQLTALLGDDESPPLQGEDGMEIEGKGAVDPATTLSCHKRLYSYKVTKTDSTGKKCWDIVNAMSCWGRCDSNEIPDWRFPYKISHHPVCLFGKKRERVHVLKNCEEGVEPETERYQFQEAETCLCTECNRKSDSVSCEGLRYRGVRSGFLSSINGRR